MKRSQVVCAAGLVIVVAWMFTVAHHPTPAPRPAPTPTVTAAVWLQHLDDACTAMDANHSSFAGTPVTGQDLDQLKAQYRTALNDWHTAASHLTPQQLSKECTP